MSAPIIGFVCALALAALVIAWITYCMFFREKHKSERHQYDMSDIRHRNYLCAQEQEAKAEKKELTAGIFVLPSRRKQEDIEYEKRPDYPESSSPVPVLPSPEKLFNDNGIDADVHFRDGIYEVDSNAKYHSDV